MAPSALPMCTCPSHRFSCRRFALQSLSLKLGQCINQPVSSHATHQTASHSPHVLTAKPPYSQIPLHLTGRVTQTATVMTSHADTVAKTCSSVLTGLVKVKSDKMGCLVMMCASDSCADLSKFRRCSEYLCNAGYCAKHAAEMLVSCGTCGQAYCCELCGMDSCTQCGKDMCQSCAENDGCECSGIGMTAGQLEQAAEFTLYGGC